jgi:hypothetical protein
MPKTPTEAYFDTLQRMTPEDLKFAHRILGWVLHTERILKMDELQEALAIEIGVPSLDMDDITNSDIIISTCGGFVEHNPFSDSVTFSHETVRPFLEAHMLTFLPSHSELCKTCLTYLEFLSLSDPPWKPPPFYKESSEGRKFGVYAPEHWQAHAIKAKRNTELETSILKSLSSKAVREVMYHRYAFGSDCNYSLLHILCDKSLTFILAEPLSGNETFEKLYISFSYSH